MNEMKWNEMNEANKVSRASEWERERERVEAVSGFILWEGVS